MSAEREESLPEYAMRVTLERDDALRQVKALQLARLEDFKALDIVRSRGVGAEREIRNQNTTTTPPTWAQRYAEWVSATRTTP